MKKNPFINNSNNGKKANREKGTWGEDIACTYLYERKYELLKRNFSCFCGEIDIIAEKDGCIHFIEVKARKGISFGYPCEAVGKKKQSKIIMTANTWIKINSCNARLYSFDVFEVISSDIGIYVRFLENAFN